MVTAAMMLNFCIGFHLCNTILTPLPGSAWNDLTTLACR